MQDGGAVVVGVVVGREGEHETVEVCGCDGEGEAFFLLGGAETEEPRGDVAVDVEVEG